MLPPTTLTTHLHNTGLEKQVIQQRRKAVA